MEQIKELEKKGLREFGLIGGSIVAVLFGFLLPVIRHHSLSLIPWVIAGVLWIWATDITASTSVNEFPYIATYQVQ